MFADAIFYYLITGAFAGFSAGLLGVGGGLIIVPVLYFVFAAQGIEQAHLMHMALATSLATIVFTSISSTLAHHKKQAVLWPLVWLIAPGIVLGAWAGGMVAADLDSDILKPVFGVFELIIAVYLLTKATPRQHHTLINKVTAGIGGITIGFISAIVGIGGGSMTVPFLHWHNIAMRNAVATSAACGLPIAITATAAFIYAGWQVEIISGPALGFVHLTAFALIVITSFSFAPLGAKVAHAIPEPVLKTGFGLFLLLLSGKMLFG